MKSEKFGNNNRIKKDDIFHSEAKLEEIRPLS